MDYRWTCGCCGKTFDTLPMDYAIEGPSNWFAVPEAERATRVRKDSDLCVIDAREFYVRGCIEVPVQGCAETFVLGVWVSVSEASFGYIVDKWTAEFSADEPPRFGWLCNWIRGYPEPDEIACHVHLRSGNLRPRIELEPTDYPLAVEQRQGITLDRVKQIFAEFDH
jgi:hypothetical protein